jgi:hypothetical protein
MIPRMLFRRGHAGKGSEVGSQPADGGFVAGDGKQVPERAGGVGGGDGGTEGQCEAVRGRGGCGKRGGEVQGDAAVVVGAGDQDAELAGEADSQRRGAVGVQGMGGGQGGVTAHIALGGGVNQRSAQSASAPSGSGRAKAVSWPSSAAIPRIQSLSGQVPESSRQTPAGSPENGRSVTAAMIRIRMREL